MPVLSTVATAVARAYGFAGFRPTVLTDPNFKQTVLLLHGDGTNGAQNNTFIDGSTNNFTITRNGNTTQGTFSPFSQAAGEWSNFFDGSGDNLKAPAGSAFQWGTGAFTIEAWIYPTVSGAFQQIWSQTVSGTNYFVFRISNTNKLEFCFNTVGGSETRTLSTASLEFNKWSHVTVVREGTGTNQLKLYINGVNDGTATCAQDFTNNTYVPTIGSYSHASAEQYTGYISNIRAVKGTAVYTSNFTVPTAPLTAITNTSLLTCQSNRFVDNSTNNFAITRNGDVRVTAFSPFAPTAAYDAATNGGSGYFDGTGDYLSFSEFSSSTDFTAECWFYRGPNATTRHLLFSANSNISASRNCQLAVSNSGEIFVALNNAVVTGFNNVGGNCVPRDSWNHIAYVRSGTNLSVFVNGTRIANGTSSATLFIQYIGALGSGGSVTADLNGYVSNARITNTAVYDPSQTSISVPTAPLTSITGTQLLLNFTNAGIIDSTGKNVLETVGNAQIDTTTKKFGTGALEFDGTGDYLRMVSTPDLYLSTGDWTIEFWVYSTNISASQAIISRRSSNTARGILLGFTSSKTILLVGDTSIAGWEVNSAGTTTLSSNTWYHYAIVRSGNTFTVYINGTQESTATSSVVIADDTSPLTIGANSENVDGLVGFLDDLRITKGVARYTANFTAPTRAFEDR